MSPIVDKSGVVQGALSIAGPAYRLTSERAELLGSVISESARRVGAQLNVSSPMHNSEKDSISVVETQWAFYGAFPQWHDKSETLYWVDTMAPTLMSLQGKTALTLARFDSPIIAMVLYEDGIIVAQKNGWSNVSWQGELTTRPGWPGKELLALCTHPTGRIWASIKTAQGCRIGELASDGMLISGWEIQERVTDICWDAKGEILYALAPDVGSILLFQTGRQTPRRLVSMHKGGGVLSGMALDTQGGVWTTLHNGWSLVRLDEEGNLDKVIGLSIPSPTDVCFGGSNRNTLYLTSSRQNLTFEEMNNAPQAGSLFIIKTTFHG